MFNKICIIGIGLIGGSIARAAREQGLANNIVAYGRDIAWVLKEMGVPDVRIVDKVEEIFKSCNDLLDKEEYDKAEQCIDELENIIGENDSKILTLRNSLAFERIDFEEDN